MQSHVFLTFYYVLLKMNDEIILKNRVELKVEQKQAIIVTSRHILDKELDKEINKIDLSKFPRIPMTALEFVDIDKNMEISADLTEKNIFDMVMNKEANEENEENQEEAPKTVTSSEASTALETILYVEQNENFNESDYFFINSLKSKIDTIKENNKQQLTIAEFIKNNSVLNLKL